MRQHTIHHHMGTGRSLLLGVFAGLLCALGAHSALADGPPVSAATLAGAEAPDTFTVPGSAAQRIYLDPETGKITATPPPWARATGLSPRIATALSTSHEGLVETPSPVAGGGVMLHLQGRFQSVLVVELDDHGEAVVRHLTAVPEPLCKDEE